MAEFDGLAPIGLRITMDIDALDDDAHMVINTSADGMQGEMVQLLDDYLGDRITGTWVVSVKVTRRVR